MADLTKQAAGEAFEQIARRFQDEGVYAVIYLTGGEIFEMARRTVTIKNWGEYDHIDWDEQHETGHDALRKAVSDAAAEHGWPDNWLAELPAPPTDPDDPAASVTVFYHPHLQVRAASPPHLLCMLLLGGRRQEVESLARLLPLVPDVRTADDMAALAQQVVPGTGVPAEVLTATAEKALAAAGREPNRNRGRP